MKRLRLVLLALMLVLVGVMGLMTKRALGGLTVERQARQRAVADDVLDDLERRLTEFVLEEESRPFAQYRYLLVPEGQVEGSVGLARSPLADLPKRDFVVGHFQVDPDGTVRTPLVPSEQEIAGLTFDWSPRAVSVARDDEIKRLVARWLDGRARRDALLRTNLDTAGREELDERSLEVMDADAMTFGKLGKESGEKRKSEPNAAYQRRGGSTRSRAAKRAVLSYDSADQFQNLAQSDVAQELKTRQQGINAPAAGATAAPPEPESVSLSPARNERRGSVEAVLDPFIGRVVLPKHLVLHRNVVIGSSLYRQGIVLDVSSLMRELTDSVLSEHALAEHVQLACGLRGSVDLAGGGAHGSVHERRFSEPFSALHASVFVGALPEAVRGTRYVLGLWGLAVFVSLVGLAAIHRMVSVQVSFAERRSNFVSAVTHELKTPLTAIRMHAEMLREGMVGSEEKRHQYHETITAESERLSRLVDNVLELSRLERGDRSVNLTVGDVTPVVREAVEILSPHAKNRGFELRVDSGDPLPAAHFDRDALLQVLLNLVDNAVKYARDAGEKEIVITCRGENDAVIVSVLDRGPGVAPRHLRHVFEAFYRSEDELTRRSKGTGIGLALVKGLVERMGGEVCARNVTPTGFEVAIQLTAAR